MSITGVKFFNSEGQHGRNLDATSNNKVVGNKGGDTPPASQRWLITEVPHKYERFTIYNTHYKKYLDYEDTAAVLSNRKQTWEIVKVGEAYKIAVDNVGTVCSLNSTAPDAPVSIRNFRGPNEQWTLEPYVDPTPPPTLGIKGIVSAAFKDRAIDNASTGTLLHTCKVPSQCTQAWYLSAEGGGYLLRAYWASSTNYLAVVNNALKLSSTKFIWTITGVDGFYKIGHSNPKESCISLPSGVGGTRIELSSYKDEHQEWFFKDYPLRVAVQGEEVAEQCPGCEE